MADCDSDWAGELLRQSVKGYAQAILAQAVKWLREASVPHPREVLLTHGETDFGWGGDRGRVYFPSNLRDNVVPCHGAAG